MDDTEDLIELVHNTDLYLKEKSEAYRVFIEYTAPENVVFSDKLLLLKMFLKKWKNSQNN